LKDFALKDALSVCKHMCIFQQVKSNCRGNTAR